MRVVHNRPPVTGREIDYIADAIKRGHLSGDGHYTKLCEDWLMARVDGVSVRLTHSCTAALEMAAILSEAGPGDEVIMPSFTFVSTANAFVLRGAVPVFVDIRPDTLNIDEALIEDAITPRTKAISVVHYAGVCCEMDHIQAVAKRHNLLVIEDAAQALMSEYKGRAAGALSSISCFSFHETKNLVSGEGGAIVLNQERFGERADIIREKGTTRVQFRKRIVDKYTWVDIGSSYLPGEITAAYLWAQLQEAERITQARRRIWQCYHVAFEQAELDNRIRRPRVPPECTHNGHIYYLLMRDRQDRDALIETLKNQGVMAPFHYIPLHSSPAGLRYARTNGELPHTDSLSGRLLRLPLFESLGSEQEFVIDRVRAYLRDSRMSQHPYLSFVVPVYGSPQSLEPLRDRIHAVCQGSGPYELILVDDRCPLGSWPVIQKLAKETPEIVGLRLSRNFGQHAAINAGLTRARGDWIVVMDCDLQDQPEEVPAMLARAIEGGFMAVRASRSNRGDSWLRRAASRAFYAVLSFLTDTHQSAGIANFGVYHRKLIDAINLWQEESKYFPAIVEWIGFSQATMPVSHGKRFAGKSSYTFMKLVRLGMNVVTGFSDKPLKILMATGLLLAVGSFAASVLLLGGYMLGLFTVEGWTSVILSLWFFSGCIIFGIGLTGLYVGRVLVEVKGRPTFLIDEQITSSRSSDPKGFRS